MQEVGVGVALVAEPVVLEEVCGSQGTPAAPQITLPPTDAIPTADAPGPSGAGGVGPMAALAVFLAIVLAGALATHTARRRS